MAPDNPGFYELDTVAQCGHTLKGEHLWTLTGTTIVPRWHQPPALIKPYIQTAKNKAYAHIRPGLAWVKRSTPTKPTAVDFDNGSEFLNWAVIAWCDERNLEITRGRSYQHNDNAHVEQRNGDWVRKHAFRYRYEGQYEMWLLNELWKLVGYRKNYLLPA